MQPPETLSLKIQQIRKEFDDLNRELYQEILNSLQLREGISYEEAMEYFSIQQEMFNSYFSSRHCGNVSLTDRIILHEKNLPKMLDFILYGIARRN